MKFSVKLAGAAAALAASAMVIAPAQAAEESLVDAVAKEVPCAEAVKQAKEYKLETFSDVYNHAYKELKELHDSINKEVAKGDTTPNQLAFAQALFGKDPNATALEFADRFATCGAVKKDIAHSTKGSAKVFGSSLASLSS